MCSHVEAPGSGWSPRGRELDARTDLNITSEPALVAETLGPEGRTQSGHVDAGTAGNQIHSAGVELLLRSALPGRKHHRKTHSELVDDGESEGEEAGGEERETVSARGLREREREVHRTRERERERSRGSDRERERGRTVRERPRSGTLSNSSNACPGRNMEDPQDPENRPGGTPGTPSVGRRGDAVTFHRCPPHLAPGSSSPALPRPSIRTRTSPLSPQRSAAEQRCSVRPSSTSGERTALWVPPWTRAGAGPPTQAQRTQPRRPSCSSSEPGEEEEEEGAEGEEEADEVEESGEAGVSGGSQGAARTLAPAVPSSLARGAEKRMSKREKNRLKSLRKRQRRRERWRPNQLQENMQSSTGNPSSSSEDESVSPQDRESYICAVCLDVYFSPYMCTPCHHIFCEPCLRALAKNNPTNTPCPLCRTIITHVYFQKELNHTSRVFFPKEYISRKQNFQKASCAKWPLPSCRKLFRIFGGFQSPANPIARRQFPHGGYRLDALDFEDDSRGWSFDMDMVIIYIYSVNWVIGFFLFCFLCYLFCPSF